MNAPANIPALCSIELEQELLGCALINQSFDAIERLVSASDFYEPLHAQLFETIAGVHAANGAVSYQLVAASMGSYAGALLSEGMTTGQYLAKLAAEACLPRDVAAHARLVREFSNRRKILAAAEALTMDVHANRPAGEAASAAIEGLDEIAVQASGAAPQVSIREAR